MSWYCKHCVDAYRSPQSSNEHWLRGYLTALDGVRGVPRCASDQKQIRFMRRRDFPLLELAAQGLRETFPGVKGVFLLAAE